MQNSYSCTNKIWCLQCSKTKPLQFSEQRCAPYQNQECFQKAFLKIFSTLFSIELILLTFSTCLLKATNFLWRIYLHSLVYMLVSGNICEILHGHVSTGEMVPQRRVRISLGHCLLQVSDTWGLSRKSELCTPRCSSLLKKFRV